jgi:hypothetical protein
LSQLEKNYPGQIEHVEWHVVQGFATSSGVERVLYYIPDGPIPAPSTYFDGGDVVVVGDRISIPSTNRSSWITERPFPN